MVVRSEGSDQFTKALSVAGTLMVALAGGACGPQLVSVHKSSFNELQKEPVTKEGVTMQVKSLGLRACWTHPVLGKKLVLAKRTADDREVNWTIVTPPAFEVKITNSTGHVLRSKGSVIKLMDSADNAIDLIDKGAALAKTTSQMSRQDRPDAQSVQDILASITSLKLLDQNIEILPDMTQTCYLAFQVPDFDTDVAFEEWLSKQSQFVVKIFDFVTETDAAGTPTKRVQFDFPVAVDTVKETYEKGMLETKLVSTEKVQK